MKTGLQYWPSHSVTSSLTITGGLWIDYPASGFGVSNTVPLGLWDVPNTAYIRSNQNGHLRLFPVDVRAGSIVDKFRIEYKGEGAGDGLSFRFVKRVPGASLWTAVAADVGSDTSAVQKTVTATLNTAETLVEGTVYGIEITATVAATAVQVFKYGFHTPRRKL